MVTDHSVIFGPIKYTKYFNITIYRVFIFHFRHSIEYQGLIISFRFGNFDKGSRKKKFFFQWTCPLRGGEGVRACPLRKKELFFFTFFFAVEKLNIFCLRRHVEILIFAYCVQLSDEKLTVFTDFLKYLPKNSGHAASLSYIFNISNFALFINTNILYSTYNT